MNQAYVARAPQNYPTEPPIVYQQQSPLVPQFRTPLAQLSQNTIQNSSEATNNSEMGLQWLLIKDPKNKDGRRKDARYQQLLGCIKKMKSNLDLKGKYDPRFGFAVSEAIESYNRVRWPGHCPLDQTSPKHCEAVGSILERNIRNSNYIKKKKAEIELSKLCDLSSDDVENNPPLTSGRDTLNENQSNQLVQTESNPVLAKNDFVLHVNDKKMALSAAIVISPCSIVGDDLDMRRADVKIVQSIADSSLAGDFETVEIKNLIYIPKQIEHFGRELCAETTTNCQRRHDCQLTIGNLILLDLGVRHKDDWPLVGKIKSYNTHSGKMTIQWFWVLDDDEVDPTKLAIDGVFGPWVQNGQIVEESVSSDCHYFCRFDLVDGRLPKCAKFACEAKLKENGND